MNGFTGFRLDFSMGQSFRAKAFWLFGVGLLVGLLLWPFAPRSVYAAPPAPSVAGTNELALATNTSSVGLSSSVAIAPTELLPSVIPTKVQPRLGPGCNVNSGNPAGTDYTTISAAIADGGCTTITVTGGGPYREQLVINRALTLNGPNAAINPNTGSRTTEVVLYLPDGVTMSDPNNQDDLSTPSNATMVRVLASNVTIAGFTLDGDNPATVGGVNLNGADVNASNGIDDFPPGNTTPANVDHIVIQNNIFKNIANLDVLFDSNGAGSGNNTISNNNFDNNRLDTYGYAIRTDQNFYADISANVMTRVRRGISLITYGSANPGPAVSITNNNVNSFVTSIFYNNFYGSASGYTISSNTLGSTQTSNTNSGFLIASQLQSVSVNISNNNITGGLYGISAVNNTTSNNLLISGGTISNISYGIRLYDQFSSAFPLAGGPEIVTLSGVTINTPTTAGVYLYTLNNLITNTVTLNMTNSFINNGPTGALLKTNYAFFNPGNTAFVGQSGDYITLNTNPNNVDGRNASYDGASGNSLSPSQYAAVEAKITDKNDNSALGLVLLNHSSGCNVNSTNPPGTDYTTISAAIADTTCTTITVTGGGPYREFVVINRALTLNGPNAGVNPNTNSRNPEAIIYLPDGVSDPLNEDTQNNGGTSSSAGVIVRVLASNVIIDGFTIDGANPTTGSGGSPVAGVLVNGVYINASTGIDNYTTAPATPQTVGNIQVQNNIIKNITHEGVLFEENSSPTSSNYIRNNKIDNVFPSDNNNGFSVRVGYNFYSEISGNVITNGRHGIMVENTSSNSGTPGLISNNTISVLRRAIWYNNNYGTSSYTISNNVINGNQATGLYFTSFFQNAQVAVSNNTITGGTSGIEAWNTYATNPLTVNGGSVTGADYGAYLYNKSSFGLLTVRRNCTKQLGN